MEGVAVRYCSKPGCPGHAVGTLTYDYQNSTVVLGPLATAAEPHSYDLCENHLTHLTVPKGWDVVRLDINYEEAAPSEDDLMALVEAVREAASQPVPEAVGGTAGPVGDSGLPLTGRRRGHFEVFDGSASKESPQRETSGEPPTPGPFSG